MRTALRESIFNPDQASSAALRSAAAATRTETAPEAAPGSNQTHLTKPGHLLHLQRTLGNRAVLQLMRLDAESAAGPAIFQRAAAAASMERDANGVTPNAGAAVDKAQAQTGQPLPDGIRHKFEETLGADLSRVRLHTDAASGEAASELGAHAYAVGQDIHFAANTYSPNDQAGLHLLAHEVVHTVQQGSAPTTPQAQLTVSAPHDPAEMEAENVASAMVSSHASTPGLHQGTHRGSLSLSGAESSQAIQRDPDPAKAPPAKAPAAAPANADPGPQGTQTYPEVERNDYYIVYQVALQGTSGKAKATPRQKADLAGQITDIAMLHLSKHGKKMLRAKAAAKDEAQSKSIDAALAGLNSPWGDFFKSALQTTAGEDFKSPDSPVKEAVDIADQAVFRAGQLDKAAWDLYIKQ